MKTAYEYIHFVKVGEKPKTSVWNCCNTRSAMLLGVVKWHATWRQYCYFPAAWATVYSAGCLWDIREFIAQINAAHQLGVKE